MASVREFFTTEATEYLDRLGNLVTGLNDSAVDPAELHKVTRALRGSAQMAREDRVYRVAAALETSARALAAKTVWWDAEMSDKILRTIDDLRKLITAAPEPDEAVDRIAADAVQRLAAEDGGSTASAAEPSRDVQFRQWAADEVAGIASELDAGLQALARDPRNREPLRSIMRRQRALSGASLLSTVPTVAETLRALEDVTRLIVRLDVAVKSEWLDAYRSGRDVLVAATAALRMGQTPPPVPALSRVRTLREELLDRYGSGEDTQQGSAVSSAAAPASATGPANPLPPAKLTENAPATEAATETNPRDAQQGQDGTEEVVAIESLLYSGDGALRRALELRREIEQATNGSATENLKELFDLIELARK